MVVIRPYRSDHTSAFKSINSEWIEEYISLNWEDNLILNNPQKMIIDKGGNIQIASTRANPIGTICLEKCGESLMITNLGVLKGHRGMGVGNSFVFLYWRKQGASKVWLETSQKLQTAISLSKTLTFEDMNAASRSSRCDVLMRLRLKPSIN
ncbi:MAG: GNAT family N-acetyltransferase [Cytophagia bacterium]|nr:GNAT family N-acetyltransferase [Cytophagia bacterium]